MVKVSASKADSYVKNPDKGIFAALLYGPDLGLVTERAHAIGLHFTADLKDPFLVANITPSMLKDNPARIHEEARTLPLTGGTRLVRVRDADDNCTEPMQIWLDDTVEGGMVIAEAGDLSTRSKLRQLFEKNANAIAIGCYPAEGSSLEQLIRTHLQTAGVSIDLGALKETARLLGNNRALVYGELDKLALYVGKQGHITADDVACCLMNSKEASLDNLVLAVGNGNAALTDLYYTQATRQGSTSTMILRALQRHLQRLDRTRAYMQTGQSAQDAMKRLRPPVFFKLKADFERQLRTLSLRVLHKMMDILLKAEQECRRTGQPEALLCARAVMACASLVRASQK